MNRLKDLIERIRQNKAIKRKAVALAESRDRIQLCEYQNATYISVNGVPVINTRWLAPDVYNVLDDARQVSSSYISERS